MEPEAFLKKWDVTYQQLADICDCSENTVKHWFVKHNQRKPSSHHLFRLAIADYLWTEEETLPEPIKQLRKMPHRRRNHTQ